MASRLTSFTHDGLTFDVTDDGPLDGEVVVLLHGFPQRASSWRRVAPLLHAQGYRTVAPDQRGYSPGARPTGRRAYAAGRLVGDVVALLDALGEPGRRVHLVGHDWGAAVGWGVAAALPDRIKTWTAVSVPPVEAFVAAGLRSRQLLRSWYMLFFQLPAVPEAVATRTPRAFERVLAAAGMREEDLARFREEIVEHGALPGGLAWYRALPLNLTRGRKGGKRGKGAGGEGSEKGRGAVRVPTTMVWSDGDAAIDRVGVDLAADHVRADYELVVLTGVSHWVPEHAPEALAEAILERVTSVPA
ncbi:alpha/beta fold hydrolase [Nocardioides zeae]|uniref:Alpha/beta fold hydrolase n=1 Tax=Nocardioides imazamoxiresistens TaxID=3231893 RepID=A0ABU3PWM1_9ACTN|nr:alpha/beta fold hydrolase [Nocardioides zeae]MDT9593635.1 alpha/beta fold hydrolase [Nocardioides zeae]